MLYYDFEVETKADAVSLKLRHTALDTLTAQRVCDQVASFAHESKQYKVLLDLANVGFVNAAALGKLIALYVVLREHGGALALVNVRLPVFEVLQLARLTELLEVRRAAGKNVLVVEDHAATRDGMRAILELAGYAVASAANGEEALEQLSDMEPPALILLDLHMPGMDGWQFRAEQQSNKGLAAIPVVLVSGGDDVSGAASALGAAAFLQKPVELEHLMNAIRQVSGTGPG